MQSLISFNKLNKNKKSQNQPVFMYLIAAIVIALMIVFSLKIINKFKEEQRDAVSVELNEKMKAAVDAISTKKGSKQESSFSVPSGAEEVCFLDLSKREEILKSQLLEKYPLMKESVESHSKENMFVIKSGKTVLSEYIGNICLDDFPYYICKETKNDLLDVLLEGRGDCASIGLVFSSCISAESNIETEQVLDTNIANFVIFPKTVFGGGIENTEICIEPVFMDVSGALSEVYNITPNGLGFGKDAEITLKFKSDLMPSKTSAVNLKVRYFDNGEWKDLTTKEASAETEKITALISILAPVALFSSDAPTAVIKDLFDNQILGTDENIDFDASPSFDPNDDIDKYEWNFGDGIISGEITTTHIYTEPGYYTVELKVTDKKNNLDIKKITLRILSKNQKNTILFNSPLFIISEEEGWQELVKVLPIVIWNSQEGINMDYPYFIYYKEEADSEDFLKPLSEYSYNKLIAFQTVPPELYGKAEYSGPDEYFSYWNYYEDIVIVSSVNKEAALMSALFASFINAPLIIADSSNIGSYSAKIKEKKVYLIGDVDVLVEDSAKENAKKVVKYSLDDIKDPTKNPYAKLYSKVRPSVFFS